MAKMTMQEALLTPSEELSGLGDTIQTQNGPLTYIDNGGDVLAVCHRDWVLWNDKPQIKRNTIKFCPQLDDRLGLWVLMNYLPHLDVPKYDILITDNEEIGLSTAEFFEPPKQYNWMFEFDRAGKDVVFYDYETDDLMDMAYEEFDFEVGFGSFTDICYLEHLGVMGINIGTGYYGAHSKACNANLRETRKQAQKFAEMLKEYSHIKIDHQPKPKMKTVKSKSSKKYYYTPPADRFQSDEAWYRWLAEEEAERQEYQRHNLNNGRKAHFVYVASSNDDLFHAECSNCGSEVDWLDTFCWDCNCDLVESSEESIPF